jgi:hypothetical protein
MRPSTRQWRAAIKVLAAAGWDERAIAAVLGIKLSTVYREIGVRMWEQPAHATCSHQEAPSGNHPAGLWCDAPVQPGQVFCDQHWRLGWPP